MPGEMSLQRIREIVAPIAAEYGVKRVYAFGSRARGEEDGRSDLDLRIDKGEIETLLQLIGFRQALEDRFPVPVDVVTSDIADKAFLREIAKDEVLLYER